MHLRPPRSTRTDTLFPSTPICRPSHARAATARATPATAAAHGRCTASTDDRGERLAQSLRQQEHSTRTQRGICRRRSEEHTSELQSLMRSSYAVFCLKPKTTLIQLLSTQLQNNKAQKQTQNR